MCTMMLKVSQMIVTQARSCSYQEYAKHAGKHGAQGVSGFQAAFLSDNPRKETPGAGSTNKTRTVQQPKKSKLLKQTRQQGLVRITI